MYKMSNVLSKDFWIGEPNGSDSWGEILGDKWGVNCINMWKATLGKRLTPENAILGHQIILLHELTHTCTDEDHKDSWDLFLCEEILSGNKQDIWQ